MAPATILRSHAGGTSTNTTPNALKSLTRRPTLVRKRDEANLDSPDPPSSPTKKAKVVFNEDVEVNLLDGWDKRPELIREEVTRALQRHARGDSEGYKRLSQVYSTDGPQDELPGSNELRYYTAALLPNVALLNRSCAALVLRALRSDWIRRDEQYVSLFTKFLGSLVSAQGAWLADTLETLVGLFLSVPQSNANPSELPTVTPALLRHRVHKALRALLRLIPTGSQVLAGVLDRLFPQPSDSKKAHIRYVHNMLAVLEYAPELQAEVFAQITGRIVKIDVQVQVDIADLEDDIGEDIVRAVSQSQEELMDASDEEEESDEESDLEDGAIDSEAEQGKKIAANIEKLDLVLDTMFDHYTNLFSDPTQAGAALDILLSHFNNIILPTYRSRHTQFLLFHFAQTSPELVDIFIGVLLRTTFDKSCAPMIRQAAASYLASFVARGSHVSTSIVRDVFDYISSHLTVLRSQFVPTCRGPDPRRYSIYYALFQALLYIFCFRWRDLTVSMDDPITPSPPSVLYPNLDDDDRDQHPTFLPDIRDALSQNIFCPLNPLRLCAPVIAQEFAGISYRLGIVYVYHLLETNKRVRLVSAVMTDHRETALSSRKGEEWQRLDGYFPFDPYKLPRSKRWLEGDYREWTRTPGMSEEEERSESSEKDEDEDEVESEETGTGGEEEE